MEVIHPTLQKPAQVVGVLARELLPKSFDFDITSVRKLCTFTPKDNDAIVHLAPGGGELIAVVGTTVNITYVTGLSTVASIAALVTGLPAAAALVSVSGDLGTFTATNTVTLDLWEDRPIPPALAYILDDDGNVVPMSGSSFTITAVVTPDRDNAYRCVVVDLGVVHAAPGLLHAIAGRNLSVVFTDGNFNLRLNAAASDPISQSPTDHGAWDNTDITQFYVENVAQLGKTAIIYVGQKV